MPRYSAWNEDEDDDRDWSTGDADDGPVDSDEEYEPTVACPACRQLIHEDADACPHCGEYLFRDRIAENSPRPWWVWAGAIAALVAMLVVVVMMLLGLIGQ